MAWTGLTLTVAGRNALNQAQLSNKMNIKSIVVGDGMPPANYSTLQGLVHQLYKLEDLKIDVTDSRCILTADFPKVDYDYYFREIGVVVITDEGEKLYVYDNCGDDAQYMVSTTGVETTQKRIRLSLNISDVADITVADPGILYVDYADFEQTTAELDAGIKENKKGLADHLGDNVKHITSEERTEWNDKQTKTGDVKDNVVTFDTPDKRSLFNTGEKLSAILGKIRKTLADLKAVAFSGSYNDLLDRPTAGDIGAFPAVKRLTNESLNDIKTPGFYYGDGNNTCTDKPTNLSAFALAVLRTGTNPVRQIAYDYNTLRSYSRFFYSTWSDWSQDILGVKGNAESTYRGGYANITPDNIGAFPGVIKLTNEDLNTIKTPGFYFGEGGNTVTNKPSGMDYFGLICMRQSGTGIMQIITASASSSEYRRTFSNNAWSGWASNVIGVKGNAESSYRKGNVNLTPDNIGAVSTGVQNLSDTAKANARNNIKAFGTGGGTVTGAARFSEGIYNYHPAVTTVSGYFHIQLTILSRYVDNVMSFVVYQRSGHFGKIILKFKNLDGLDPELDFFYSTDTVEAYIYKSAVSTWEIFIYKTAHDYIDVYEFNNPNRGYILWTWEKEDYSTLPAGSIAATKYIDNKYVNKSGDIMSGNLEVQKTFGDAVVGAKRTDLNIGALVDVANSGNHGLWSTKKNDWIVYAKPDGTTYLKGTAERVSENDINIVGDMIGSASFDGSDDVEIAVTKRGCTVGQSSSTSTNPWYKFASATVTTSYTDGTITFHVMNSYAGQGTKLGILTAHFRTSGSAPGMYDSAELVWEYAVSGIDPNDFVLAYKVNQGVNIIFELWVKIQFSYRQYHFDVISEGDRITRGRVWILYNTVTPGSQASLPSGYTTIASTLAVIQNNSGFFNNIKSDSSYMTPVPRDIEFDYSMDENRYYGSGYVDEGLKTNYFDVSESTVLEYLATDGSLHVSMEDHIGITMRFNTHIIGGHIGFGISFTLKKLAKISNVICGSCNATLTTIASKVHECVGSGYCYIKLLTNNVIYLSGTVYLNSGIAIPENTYVFLYIGQFAFSVPVYKLT